MIKMESRPYLSVVIPAYNEAGRKGDELKSNIEEIGKYLGAKGITYELIVVSDGSKDDTVEFARGLSGLVSRMDVVDRKENKGKWYSVREGLLRANGQYCLFTDADGATPINNLDNFWAHMENGEDIIIGSRDLKESKIQKHQPKWKELMGDAGNLLIQFLMGLQGIEDTQCGFKVVSKQVVDDVVSQLAIDRWGGDFEMLAIARKMKYKIVEVPVTWIDAGQSLVGVSGLGGYTSTLKELFQVKWRLITGKYNLKKQN
jgi:glycosyltransferase involved in cell wall biosynthesis